jgi:serine/threonine protein kinase
MQSKNRKRKIARLMSRKTGKRMTLEEKSRLSYYRKIADISEHENTELVQHIETRRIYVKKQQTVYDREVYRILQEAEHPFFPKIIECMEDEGTLILIESYISGATIQEKLDAGERFSAAQTADYIIQICDGLSLLHDQVPPIVHRDIKPSNLIVTEEGQVKMVDCNAARQVDLQKSRDTTLIGTWGYAAPEQCGFRQSDPRTDIYALGVLANVMLTGGTPSEGPDEGIPGAIIQKCMEMDPDHRYQNLTQLKEAWQQVAGQICLTSEPNGLDRIQKNQAQLGKKEDCLHAWALPGFRTRTGWKMAVACVGYALMCLLPFYMKFQSGETYLTGLDLWANRCAIWMIEVGSVLLWGDYRGIQEKIPLPRRHRVLKTIVIVLYNIALVFLMALIVVLIENP